jgi:hypothetical protein
VLLLIIFLLLAGFALILLVTGHGAALANICGQLTIFVGGSYLLFYLIAERLAHH